MEDSSCACVCRIMHDDFNSMTQRDIKFRRCYGTVKINLGKPESTIEEDEIGVIIDKIQEVTDDVFLTRECNNFDIINLDSSQNSLLSGKCICENSEWLNNNTESNSAELEPKESSNEEITDSNESESNEKIMDESKVDFCSSNKDMVVNNKDSISSITSFFDASSDRVNDSFLTTQKQLFFATKDTLNQEQNSFNFKCPKKYKEKSDKVYNHNLKRGLILNNGVKPTITSSENKDGIRSLTPDDLLDSEDSDKWDNHVNNTTFNACYFFSSDNSPANQFNNVCNIEMEPIRTPAMSPRLSADEELRAIEDNSKDIVLNGSFYDNVSVNSFDTSYSTSSAFESALSSNEAITPYGTPRNSLSKNSSMGSAQRKKVGISFAFLKSDNLSHISNKINSNFDDEKNLNSTSSNDEYDYDRNQNISAYKKVYSCHSIRKLLNLTSHKRQTNNEKRDPDKIINKKEFDNQSNGKDSPKTISLKNRYKKINLKEFYLSRRNKITTLRMDERLRTQSSINSDNFDNEKELIIEQNLDFLPLELDEKNKCTESLSSKNVSHFNVKGTRKFISKIPRPISKRNNEGKMYNQSDKELLIHGDCYKGKKKLQLCESDLIHSLDRSLKSDRSETASRPSDSSESSYKIVQLLKECKKKKNCESISKTVLNAAQIDVLRSKYWIKEDKNNILSLKNDDSKSDAYKKKGRSNINVSPISTNEPHCGNMVRVKTAPIRSIASYREKSIIKEKFRIDAASSLKIPMKTPKVVSIPSLDAKRKN